MYTNSKYSSKRYNNTRETSSSKCYECGESRHLRYNCPKLHNQVSNSKQTKYGKHTVTNTGQFGSGLFIEARINNFPATCLVDTGATLTIVSRKFMGNINSPMCLYD
jgi:hypothetical protein